MSGILYWIVIGLIAGWLAPWSDERRWLRRCGGYYPGHPWRDSGRMAIRDAAHFHGWRFNWRNHRGLRRRGYSGRDHAIAEKSLTYAGVRPVKERALRVIKSKSRRLPGVGRPARFPSGVTQLLAARSARVAKYHSAVGARWNFKCSSAASAFFASPDFWRARIRYLIASGECGSAESSSPAFE
jgi:hypothetical protein